MDKEDLMAMLDYVDKSSLAYVDYKTDAHHVVISKEVPNYSAPSEKVEVAAPTSQPIVSEVGEAPLEEMEASGMLVEAPMVGVVYLQPHPDEAPFVKVGDRVEQGQVVCIVEAMKLMNEIQAPCSGVVTEILVENEQVVEFNQPIIRIEE